MGFPCGSAGKESPCNLGDLGSIPGMGRSTGEGKGYLLQYSGLANSMDCIVHGVTKSWTQLSDFHYHISRLKKGKKIIWSYDRYRKSICQNPVLKNWCFWTVVLEKTLESPLDSKEIQPVHPKGDQSWVFIGRTDAEAGTPILWPPDVKNSHIGKDPDLGKIEGRRRGWQMLRWLDSITDLMDLSSSKHRELVIDREAWHAAVHGVTKSRTWVSDWTELNWMSIHDLKNLSIN